MKGVRFPRLRRVEVGLLGLVFVAQSDAVPLVMHDGVWRYWVGTVPPQENWTMVEEGALDPGWLSGVGGFGFGDNDDATVLSDMRANYRTVAIRRVFEITEPLPIEERIFLRADYDDGFVAYLDGVEIARRWVAGTPGSAVGWNVDAEEDHEASGGNNSPQPVEEIDCGAAGARLAPGSHALAIIGFNDSIDSSDFSMIFDLYTGPKPVGLSGVISEHTTWTREGSPYEIVGPVTVAKDVVLMIEPGVEVRFGQGMGLTVNGQVKAEGSVDQPIVFTRRETASSWRRIDITGNENVFRHCFFRFGASQGTVRATDAFITLDHCTFADTEVAMVDLIDSSCRVTHCVFPGIASSEPFHFDGMPPNGEAYIAFNRFGAPTGYNDVIDFTGGNRPGPIVEFIGNIFEAGVDEVLDMDGTDAHIEGNIFLNIRKDARRSSSSSPISTGASGNALSELVICRNWFYNTEHVLLLKNRGTAVLQHNTVLRLTDNPFSTNAGEAPGIILFGEPWRGDPYGRGALLEGNVFAGLEVSNLWPLLSEARTAENAFLQVRHCLFQGFDVEGVGNLNALPLFVSTAEMTPETMMARLSLQPESPGVGAGPYGLDMGAAVQEGVALMGGPSGTTKDTTASFVVTGPGIWSFRWRLDDGAWSEEIDVVPAAIKQGGPLTPTMHDSPGVIELAALSPGLHTLEVQGRNSAGRWQAVSSVRTWPVEPTDLDTDNDGLPDAWEVANGLDPTSAVNPHGAAGDLDGDGLTNEEEYHADTKANDATSRLHLINFNIEEAGAALTWSCVKTRRYRVGFSEDLVTWTYVKDTSGEPLIFEGTEEGVASATVAWPAIRPLFWRVDVVAVE